MTVKAAKSVAGELENRGTGSPRGVYRIGLANGLSWKMVTTDQTEPVFADLSAVMGLERRGAQRSPEYRRFIPRSSPSPRREGAHDTREGDLIRHGALEMRPCGNWTYLVSSVSPMGKMDLNVQHVWGSFFPFYRRLIDSGGIPLHAALVGKGDAYALLAARGKTGKSTCCRRLPPVWHVLCDDETIVVPVGRGAWRIHPFPTWSDIVERGQRCSWNVQKSFPLSALFFLKQGKVDGVKPVGQGEAVMELCPRVREKCYFHEWGLEADEERELRLKLFENARRLAAGVPAYSLSVSLDGHFWEGIEKTLSELGSRGEEIAPR